MWRPTAWRICAAAALRGLGLMRGAQGLEALQRELRVDDQRRGRSGQAERAVGPRAVGQAGLKREAARGQGIADDRLHAHLAEGAARLLVRQDVLQADDAPGEIGDIGLRRVDDRQPLIKLRKLLGGVALLRLQMFAEMLRDAVEPVLQRAGKLGLPAQRQLRQ